MTHLQPLKTPLSIGNSKNLGCVIGLLSKNRKMTHPKSLEILVFKGILEGCVMCHHSYMLESGKT